MNEYTNNVTMRTYRRRISNESVNNSFISTTSDLRARSLPDLSSEDLSDDDLHNEIINLKSQLSSAHKEIEELSLKVSLLLKENEKKQSTINKLKLVCTAAPLSSARNDKKYRRTSQQKLNSSIVDLGLSEDVNFNSELEPSCLIHEGSESLENSNIILLPSNSLLEGPTSTKTTEILQASNSPLEGATSTKTTQNAVNKPKLLIYGTQQCTGLASILINFRQNLCSKYEDYDIFAITKPFAKSEDVIRDCLINSNLNVERDQIVLCVGENDNNPSKLLYELSGVFKRLEKCNIIVLNINDNPFLNTVKLNSAIQILCKYVPNCNFVTCQKRYQSNSDYLLELSKKISFIIDCRYYDSNFLNVSKIRNYLHGDENNVKHIKRLSVSKRLVQTTITCFYKNSVNKSNVVNSTQVRDRPKRRTLLDYYSITHKRTKGPNERERSTAGNINNQNNMFFRSQ